MNFFVYILLSIIFSTQLMGVGDIRVQGRYTLAGVALWATIDDGDQNPNQVVTDFGTVLSGTTGERTYRIQNRDDSETLTVTVDAVFDTPRSDSAEFTFPDFPTQNFTIAPGEDREFSIRYTPIEAETTTEIRIDSNSGSLGDSERVYTFAITGKRTGPAMRLIYDSETVGVPNRRLENNEEPSLSNGTDFGSRRVGGGNVNDREVIRSFFIVNGTADNDDLNLTSATITGPQASDFRMANLTVPVSLDESTDETFRLVYNPSAPGERLATLTIRSNDPFEDPFIMNLKGSATAFPDIKISGMQEGSSGGFKNIARNDSSPENADGTFFVPTPVGSSSDSIFEIYNAGDALLNFPDLTTTGSQSSEFTFISTDSSVMVPGERREVKLRFTPIANGQRRATARFDSTTEGEPNFVFEVEGTGQGPAMKIFWRDEDGINPELLSGVGNSPLSSNGSDFGEIAISTTTTRTFRIENVGFHALEVTSFSLLGDSADEFELSGLPANIAGGSNHDFTISCTPQMGGISNAMVRIFSNDTLLNPFLFNLRRNGIVGEPGISISGRGMNSNFEFITNNDTTPSSLDGTFIQSVEVGESREYEFKIRNPGTGALEITSANIVGTLENEWFISDLVTVEKTLIIPPESDHFFKIKFQPLDTGSETVTFELESNVPDASLFRFALSSRGTGTAQIQVAAENGAGDYIDIADGDLLPDQEVVQFGTLLIGESVTRNFRITNDGNDRLIIMDEASSHPDFTINGLKTVIAPGSSDFFTITFMPGTVKSSIQAEITLPDSIGLPDTPYRFAVTGGGIAPKESRGVITDFRSEGDDLILVITVTGNDTYKLTSNTDLESDWTLVLGQSGLSSGVIRLEDVINQEVQQPRRFYRLEKE